MFVIPLRLISRYQAPKYSFSIFNRIFKKKQFQSQNKPQTERQTNNPPKQQVKPQKQTSTDEVEDYDLFSRQKQNLRNVDYEKLKQISKQIPEDIGKAGIDEIIFWADGVENPEQIFKLVSLFNAHWSPDQANKLSQNYKFSQFCNKVVKFSYLAKDFNTINNIAQFGLLYNIREEQLWNKLEEKLLYLLKNNLDLEMLCQILLKFVKMRQGDMIYYKTQDLAQANLDKLTPSSISKILFSLFQRQTGYITTIKKYLSHFMSKLDVATAEDLVLFSTFLPFVKIENMKQILDQLEKKVIEDNILQKLNLEEVAVLARSFGNQFGSDQFWKAVELVILKNKSLTLAQSQYVIYGPLNSYRLTLQNAKTISDMVLQNINNFKATHLSQLSKVLYIYQLDNQTTYQKIQGLIMQQLQDLSITPLEQLMNICKNYSVTRHGSRDIYKLLEVVIMARMEEIKMNRKVFGGIYNIYSKSDLCSAELIKEFAKYR